MPDTGYDPSKIAIQPTARKRGARTSGLGGGGGASDTITRQANATLKHLQELDRESSRDVQIALPKGAGGGRKGKNTTNVRRILMSNKTFANHLADEEAALAMEAQQMPGASSVKTAKGGPAVGNKGAATAAVDPQPRDTVQQALTKEEPLAGSMLTQQDPESDHLLKTFVPSAPTEAEMEALVSAPPLSYNQARAVPSVGKPQRHFCEICGYWGSIRCMRCGARVCGLECKGAHDEGRCLRY